MTHRQKDAYDKQKADELAKIIEQQDAALAKHAAEQAERYAQIDAARDAEIQRLIAESEADDEPHTDAEILEAVRTYPASGFRNRKGYPVRKYLREHAGFDITPQQRKRACRALEAEGQA